MPLSFPNPVGSFTLWGGPPGPQPTPTSARWEKSGSRGTRADQGVCPTIASASPVSGKLSGIGMASCPTVKLTGYRFWFWPQPAPTRHEKMLEVAFVEGELC